MAPGTPRAVGGVCGASWSPRGRSWKLLRVITGRLGEALVAFWAVLGNLGGVLESSWGVFESSWGRSGCVQGCLGSRLDRLVVVLGTFWGVSGPSCALFHVGSRFSQD